MSSGAEVRARAAKVVSAVLNGSSMDGPLEKQRDGLSPKDQAFLSALVYGCIRRMPQHELVIRSLLRNPNKPISPMVRALLVVGVEQIAATRVPPHAAVSATVAASKRLKQTRSSGFINAILRNYIREQEQIESKLQNNEQYALQHPKWLVEQLRSDWPEDWRDLIETNNYKAPMWLRVNAQKISRDDYLVMLQQSEIEATVSDSNQVGLRLHEAVGVDALPGFADGLVSVQDIGAQYAAELLAPKAGERILDACAAPGGKTMHILEQCPAAVVTALDLADERLQKVRDTAQRIGVDLVSIAANAADIESWWNGEMFDAILVDAPCSGSGVIRRHPDIKMLRRSKDLTTFADLQLAIVQGVWKTLKPGGRMIYATCSVFADENERLISRALKVLQGAQAVSQGQPWAHAKSLKYGIQMLPNKTGGDGFYYAALAKAPYQDS